MPAATRNVRSSRSRVAVVGLRRARGRPTRSIESARAASSRWGADEQGGEPYVFEDPARGGALVGFEVDLADALARALGVRARFVQNDWSTLVPSLERGTLRHRAQRPRGDAGARGAHRLLAPVLPVHASGWSRAAATRACAISRRCAGCASARWRAAWRGTAGAATRRASRVPYEGVDEPFVDLAHGRIDAVLLDDIIVARYAARHPTLAVVARRRRGAATRSRVRPRRRRSAAGDRSRARRELVASGELAAHPRALAARRPAPGGAGRSRPTPAAAGRRRGGRRCSPRQLALFLQGALVTLLISLAAMALAAPLGLAAGARAPDEPARCARSPTRLRRDRPRHAGAAAALRPLLRPAPT